jgi:hypothetical protein
LSEGERTNSVITPILSVGMPRLIPRGLHSQELERFLEICGGTVRTKQVGELFSIVRGYWKLHEGSGSAQRRWF